MKPDVLYIGHVDMSKPVFNIFCVDILEETQDAYIVKPLMFCGAFLTPFSENNIIPKRYMEDAIGLDDTFLNYGHEETIFYTLYEDKAKEFISMYYNNKLAEAKAVIEELERTTVQYKYIKKDE